MSDTSRQDRFADGYESGYYANRAAQLAGDWDGAPCPDVDDEDFQMGWNAGVCDSVAEQKGKLDAGLGIYTCPYIHAEFRDIWAEGYFEQVLIGMVAREYRA